MIVDDCLRLHSTGAEGTWALAFRDDLDIDVTRDEVRVDGVTYGFADVVGAVAIGGGEMTPGQVQDQVRGPVEKERNHGLTWRATSLGITLRVHMPSD